MKNMNRFAEVIEKRIGELFSEKQDAAAAAGLSPGVLRNYAKGRRLPDDPIIPRLALALNFDELYLFQLKYEGGPLERHLGSPDGGEKRKPTALDKFDALFRENDVSPELRDRCYAVCREIIQAVQGGEEGKERKK